MSANRSQFDVSQLAGIATELVAAAKQAGADAADAVAVRTQSLNVDVRLGKPEEAERSESDDFTLRVFKDSRSAAVSANQTGNPQVLAERAVAMAKVSPENPYEGLAPSVLLAREFPDLDLLDATTPGVDDLEVAALECEEAALGVHGIANSGGASASWGIGGIALATSEGFQGSYLASSFSRAVSVVAGEGSGMERDYDYDSKVYIGDLKSAAEIGRSAAERTIKRLSPRQVKTTTAPVVFDPRVSNSLAGHFASAINGGSVARKTGFLIKKMGEKVFPAGVTITDNPLLVRGLASRPFDGEGVESASLTLVDDGILQCWLLNCATAAEIGLETNGRACRNGGSTSPGSTNLAIQPGKISPDEMISNIDSGLYVTELIGQGVNPVSGDYSRGASGFWIENGEVSYPVSEITIAGNLVDMFARLVPANDLVYRYRSNAPTILIEDMTIAGT